MPHKEVRYVGVSWQVLVLPDGTKELTFTDPDDFTIHVLPLPKLTAEAIAAQLRGEEFYQ